LKKNKISKNWLNQQKNDSYFKKAKIEGYRSRSAFKLIEMNKKFKFLKKNITVLDLGSTPGGWSQVVRKEVGKSKILAVDIKNMYEINNVKFIKGNFNESKNLEKIFFYFKNNKVDVVLSDMAANTTGNKTLDSYNTGKLCLDAMSLATKVLRTDGVFLSKVFMGSIFLEIHEKAKKTFQKVIKYKPQSSKKKSKEIYIYCKDILKV
jgi:23S rRNA (uridine2552-2'-O)-methyltransferase